MQNFGFILVWNNNIYIIYPQIVHHIMDKNLKSLIIIIRLTVYYAVFQIVGINSVVHILKHIRHLGIISLIQSFGKYKIENNE